MESSKTRKLSKTQILLLLMNSVPSFPDVPGSVFWNVDSDGLHPEPCGVPRVAARLHARPCRLNVREVRSSLHLVIFSQKKTGKGYCDGPSPAPAMLFLLNEPASAEANGHPLTTTFILVILAAGPCSKKTTSPASALRFY